MCSNNLRVSTPVTEELDAVARAFASQEKYETALGLIEKTIALEPKLIFPGKGVVGIENTHVVTENGLDQLGSFEEDIIII